MPALEKHAMILMIEAFVEKHGGNFSDYYIGITKNKDTRLFIQHNVKKKDDIWMCEEAADIATARAVESYFIDLNIDGGSGGGDDDSKFVYVYKKTKLTKENIEYGDTVSFFDFVQKTKNDNDNIL